MLSGVSAGEAGRPRREPGAPYRPLRRTGRGGPTWSAGACGVAGSKPGICGPEGAAAPGQKLVGRGENQGRLTDRYAGLNGGAVTLRSGTLAACGTWTGTMPPFGRPDSQARPYEAPQERNGVGENDGPGPTRAQRCWRGNDGPGAAGGVCVADSDWIYFRRFRRGMGS